MKQTIMLLALVTLICSGLATAKTCETIYYWHIVHPDGMIKNDSGPAMARLAAMTWKPCALSHSPAEPECFFDDSTALRCQPDRADSLEGRLSAVERNLKAAVARVEILEQRNGMDTSGFTLRFSYQVTTVLISKEWPEPPRLIIFLEIGADGVPVSSWSDNRGSATVYLLTGNYERLIVWDDPLDVQFDTIVVSRNRCDTVGYWQRRTK